MLANDYEGMRGGAHGTGCLQKVSHMTCLCVLFQTMFTSGEQITLTPPHPKSVHIRISVGVDVFIHDGTVLPGFL